MFKVNKHLEPGNDSMTLMLIVAIGIPIDLKKDLHLIRGSMSLIFVGSIVVQMTQDKRHFDHEHNIIANIWLDIG